MFRYDVEEMRWNSGISKRSKQTSHIPKKRLEIFLEVLDEVDAETADVEEIDRLIQMIDEIEKKLEQFKSNDR